MTKFNDQMDAIRYSVEAGVKIIHESKIELMKVEKVDGLTFGVLMTINLSEFSKVERSQMCEHIDRVKNELDEMISRHRFNRIKNNLEREF